MYYEPTSITEPSPLESMRNIRANCTHTFIPTYAPGVVADGLGIHGVHLEVWGKTQARNRALANAPVRLRLISRGEGVA